MKDLSGSVPKQNIYLSEDLIGGKEVTALSWHEDGEVKPSRTHVSLPEFLGQPRGWRTNSEECTVSGSGLAPALSSILSYHLTGSHLPLAESDHLEVPIWLLLSFPPPFGKNGTTIPPSSEPPSAERSLEVTRNQDSSWLATVIHQSKSHSF